LHGRTPEGVFYYAMELFQGASLDDVVEFDGPQPPERVSIKADGDAALTQAGSITPGFPGPAQASCNACTTRVAGAVQLRRRI
jgi:hypothetical protein